MIVFNLFKQRTLLYFNIAIILFFLKMRILMRCLKQGSFSQHSNGESQERCEPCVVRARPSVPPQGLQTWIFDFSHKGTGAKNLDMATTQKLSICFPSMVIYISVAEFGKHCCNILDMFSIQCFTFLFCIIQKRKYCCKRYFKIIKKKERHDSSILKKPLKQAGINFYFVGTLNKGPVTFCRLRGGGGGVIS